MDYGYNQVSQKKLPLSNKMFLILKFDQIMSEKIGIKEALVIGVVGLSSNASQYMKPQILIN